MITKDSNSDTLSLRITREDGSTFVNESGLKISTTAFDQIFIGEVQGSVKYGNFAEIMLDNIAVQIQ